MYFSRVALGLRVFYGVFALIEENDRIIWMTPEENN